MGLAVADPRTSSGLARRVAAPAHEPPEPSGRGDRGPAVPVGDPAGRPAPAGAHAEAPLRLSQAVVAGE